MFSPNVARKLAIEQALTEPLSPKGASNRRPLGGYEVFLATAPLLFHLYIRRMGIPVRSTVRALGDRD